MACTVIDRRNDFKMLKTLHENMNIEHFDAISMVDDSIEREKLLSICYSPSTSSVNFFFENLNVMRDFLLPHLLNRRI